MTLFVGKTPKQVILDLIKAKNPAASVLTEAALVFALPAASDGTESTPRNTQMEVSAAEGSGYAGEVLIKYDRLLMEDVVNTQDRNFPIGSATKVADLIDAINTRYKINLGEGDYVDDDLPEFTGGVANETHDFTLTITADALLFQNTVTLTLVGEDVDLSTIITDPVLDGLTLPE